MAGEILHVSSNPVGGSEPVAHIRAGLHNPRMDPCRCASLPDPAAVPMGGDGLDERVFASIDRVRAHGEEKWWLSLSTCRSCGQHWLVAQEERIFDAYFLRRLDEEAAGLIVGQDRWPDEFLTYGDVLVVGRSLCEPARFFDLLSPSLVYTVEDLLKQRPDIRASEIGYLLGLLDRDAAYLMALPFPAPDALEWEAWQDEVRRSGGSPGS